MPHATKESRQAYLARPEVGERRRQRSRAKDNRHHSLKSRTGWTPQRRAEALERQQGRCDICTRELGDKGINCDHSHKTLKPRALLCRACNLGLGWYEKWQRPAGLYIAPYELYLAQW